MAALYARAVVDLKAAGAVSPVHGPRASAASRAETPGDQGLSTRCEYLSPPVIFSQGEPLRQRNVLSTSGEAFDRGPWHCVQVTRAPATSPSGSVPA